MQIQRPLLSATNLKAQRDEQLINSDTQRDCRMKLHREIAQGNCTGKLHREIAQGNCTGKLHREIAKKRVVAFRGCVIGLVGVLWKEADVHEAGDGA
jgi:hypothetical protein